MKKIFFFLSIAVFSSQLFGQSEYQRYITPSTFNKVDVFDVPTGLLHRGTSGNGMDEGFCLISDSGTITWNNFFQSNSQVTNSLLYPISDTEFIHLSYVDSNTVTLYKSSGFTFLWKKVFDLHSSVDSNNYSSTDSKIIELSNGNICVIGMDGVPIFSGFGIAESPHVYLFDAFGNLLWSKLYQSGNNSFIPKDAYLSSNGNLVLLGSCYKTSGPGLVTNNGFATMAVNISNGTMSGSGWLNFFLGQDQEISYRMYDNNNSSFICGAFNISATTNINSTLLIKINETDGTFISAKKIDANTPIDGLIPTYSTTQNGNLYYSGVYIDGSQTPTVSFPFCFKTDSTISTVNWAMTYYNDPTEEGEIDILKHVNGALLAAGVYDSKTSYLWKINQNTGTAACGSTSKTLNITNYTVDDTLMAVTILHNEYLLSGTPASFVNDVAVTNSCSINNVCEVLGVDEFSENSDVFIYPNPAKDYFSLKIPDCLISKPSTIKFYNTQGQIVKISSINDFLNIEISDLEVGLYFFVLTGAEKIYNGKILISK